MEQGGVGWCGPAPPEVAGEGGGVAAAEERGWRRRRRLLQSCLRLIAEAAEGSGEHPRREQLALAAVAYEALAYVLVREAGGLEPLLKRLRCSR